MAKLWIKTLTLAIISYVVFWGGLAELGLAIMTPLGYWYINKYYTKVDKN